MAQCKEIPDSFYISSCGRNQNQPDCSRKWCRNNSNSHKREKARGEGYVVVWSNINLDSWAALWALLAHEHECTEGFIQLGCALSYTIRALTSLLWHFLHATRAAGWFLVSSHWVSGRTRQTSCAEQRAVAVILFVHFPFLVLAVLIQFLALPQTFCAGLKNKHDFSAIQFLICEIIIKLGDEWIFSVQQPNCQIKWKGDNLV